MNYLTECELSALRKLSAGLISKKELDFIITRKAALQEMECFLDKFIFDKNVCGFEAVLWNMPNTMTKEEENYLYKKYLLLDGHFQYENMISAFQTYFNEDKDNIPILLQAIKEIPEYLNYDDVKYPYIRKIIYAIGAQPEPYNIRALEELSNSDDEQIKELALHQIEKRKTLGRWEYEKNKSLEK